MLASLCGFRGADVNAENGEAIKLVESTAG